MRLAVKYAKVFLLTVTFAVAIGCNTAKEVAPIRIGLLMYNTENTFISLVKNTIESRALTLERELNQKISIVSRNARGDQLTQIEQLKALIERKVDVLCVNIVERKVAAQLVDMAREANIPIIFFNRQPVDEDINRWEKCYYIGMNGELAGRLQGQAVLELWQTDLQNIDRNGDGILQYVMLEGEPGHQDTLLRTEHSIKELEAAEIKTQRIGGGVANWKKDEAGSIMHSEITRNGKNIEVVFANNDDMALGAIYAIKESNLGYMPTVVGVDGIEEARQSVDEGDLYATVLYDNTVLSEQLLRTSVMLARGERQSQKFIWIAPSLIRRESAAQGDMYSLQKN